MVEDRAVSLALGFVALVISAVWGVWMLLGVGATAPEWIITTVCLSALSLANGARAAFRTRRFGGASRFFGGLIWQILLSLVVVAFSMGGGPTLWSVGFWIVSSIGWGPGYVWFFLFAAWLMALFKWPANAAATQAKPRLAS